MDLIMVMILVLEEASDLGKPPDKKMRIQKSLFFAPRNKRIARIVSVKSPTAFRRSIRTLKQDGLNRTEKRALTLARTRAKIQLKRKHLSMKERKQFKAIAGMRIPKVKR